jgi:hypothetical protein
MTALRNLPKPVDLERTRRRLERLEANVPTDPHNRRLRFLIAQDIWTAKRIDGKTLPVIAAEIDRHHTSVSKWVTAYELAQDIVAEAEQS